MSRSQSTGVHKPLSSIPIDARNVAPNWVQTGVFAFVFNASIISLHLLQLVATPLAVFSATRPAFDKIIIYTKENFGRLLLLISQWFGPTRIVLSFSDEESRPLDPQQYVINNKKGAFEGLNLPLRSVWMSNHQVYTDWLYLWCVAYYADLHGAIMIILKNTLKWIPFVGWGMQFYRFIFLARNWASDRLPLAKHLTFMAERASRHSASSLPSKLLLLIFPEGTLVSKDTRPQSKRYAGKMGFNDLENLLLPRSTGLLFCLRTLASQIDDLELLDFTIGYPGIPPAGYGQSFYTLRSIFMQGIPPPAIHIHCTITRVSGNPSGVPLGKLPSGLSAAQAVASEDASQEERDTFDAWLRSRWERKDALMHQFYVDGDFVKGAFAQSPAAGEYRREKGQEGLEKPKVGGGETKAVPEREEIKYLEIPVGLRSNREIGDVFAWGAAWGVIYGVVRALKWVGGSAR